MSGNSTQCHRGDYLCCLMQTIYIGIGGNIGRRERFIAAAVQLIATEIGRVAAESQLYKTAPWGMDDADDFLNAVVEVHTDLDADTVMMTCLRIEHRLGRKRSILGKYTSRTIDLDLLFYGQEVIRVSSLTVPHPQLENRRFVLQPLAEIAPAFTHPILKRSMRDLLNDCADETKIELWQSPTATLA